MTLFDWKCLSIAHYRAVPVKKPNVLFLFLQGEREILTVDEKVTAFQKIFVPKII